MFQCGLVWKQRWPLYSMARRRGSVLVRCRKSSRRREDTDMMLGLELMTGTLVYQHFSLGSWRACGLFERGDVRS